MAEDIFPSVIEVDLVGPGAYLANDYAEDAKAYASAAGLSAVDAASSASDAQESEETVQAIEGAVLDAIAGLPVDATLPLQALTRSAMALFTGMTAGRQAYLSEAGREGMFRWNAASAAAKVTQDNTYGGQRALVIPPASDTTGASGAWERINTDGFYGLTWWGAVGDGDDDGNGTDNTTALQTCLNHVEALGGGTISVRPGHYCIKGALLGAVGTKSQVIIPFSNQTTDSVCIRILGASPPGSYTVPAPGATIFHTTLTTGPGAMIGGRPTNGVSSNGTQNSWYFENLIFRAPKNPAVMAVDASYIPVIFFRSCRFDTVHLETGFTKPTNVLPAVRGPINDVPLYNNYDDVTIVGWYYGLEPGELAYLNNVNISNVIAAIHIRENQQHPTILNRVVITACDIGLKASGKVELRVNSVTIEHNSRPGWTAPGVFQYDIDDPTNLLRGRVREGWHMHDASASFTMNGGAKLDVRPLPPWQKNDEPYSRIFTTFPTLVNASSLIENIANVTGVPAWMSQGGIRSAQGDPVAVWSAANFGGASRSDYRIGQIQFYYDVNPESGGLAMFTAKDGVVNSTPAININRDNRVIMAALPVYADNAAAIAGGLSVGMLYTTAAGDLRVRV